MAGHRGREVLAGRPQRPAPPRRPGRPDRLRRRPEGVPRGDRGRLPAGLGADLHRAPDPRLACATSTTATASRSPPPCARSTPPPTPTPPLAELERFDEQVGRALPDDRRRLARALGAHHPVPRAARRAAPRGLHHQHDRGPPPPDPQGDQDPRTLPRRTGRHQAHLPRHHQAPTPSGAPAPGQPPAPPSRSTSETDSPADTTPSTSRLGLTHRRSDSLHRRGPDVHRTSGPRSRGYDRPRDRVQSTASRPAKPPGGPRRRRGPRRCRPRPPPRRPAGDPCRCGPRGGRTVRRAARSPRPLRPRPLDRVREPVRQARDRQPPPPGRSTGSRGSAGSPRTSTPRPIPRCRTTSR